MDSVKVSPENVRLISMPERLLILSILSTVVLGSYMYLNRNPPFTPRLLPMTSIDTATPFLVWTIWPYALLNVSDVILPFFILRRDEFFRMAATLSIAMGTLIVFWTLWPTTFPRPPIPGGDTLTEQLYLFFIRNDAPVNCFPSAHVTAPAILLFFVCRARPKLTPWFWSVFALFSLSILTTKQHYAWDLVGAMIIVFVSLKITARIDWTGRFGQTK